MLSKNSKQRDGNIVSYFQSDKEEDRSKTEALAASAEDEDIVTQCIEKGKHKMIDSSLPPESKRRDTKLDTRPYLSSKDLPPNWLSEDSAKDVEGRTTLSISIQKGDLFQDTSDNALLIHACNTQGSWNAGIARAFRHRYPKAYTVYRDFCTKEHNPITNPVLTGTALLISPIETGAPEHWIGCLFTSAKYGKAKAKPEAILRDTVPAMQMLLELASMTGKIGDAKMCKINSGLFAVPWEKTAEALEGIQVQEGWKSSIVVWEP